MEDIRPYMREEDEWREQFDENPVEWELARLDTDEEPPFHLPRD